MRGGGEGNGVEGGGRRDRGGSKDRRQIEAARGDLRPHKRRLFELEKNKQTNKNYYYYYY